MKMIWPLSKIDSSISISSVRQHRKMRGIFCMTFVTYSNVAGHLTCATRYMLWLTTMSVMDIYPQGRVFLFVLGARPIGLFSRILSRHQKPIASIVIECEHILRISGCLSDFKLSMKHMEIDCRDGQVVIPTSKTDRMNG